MRFFDRTLAAFTVFLLVALASYGQDTFTGGRGGSGSGVFSNFTANPNQFTLNGNTNFNIKSGALVTGMVARTSLLLDYATASRPLLTDGSKNAVSGILDLANTNHNVLSNTWFATSSVQFTNIVNQLNALSVDGIRRTVKLSPGHYTNTHIIHLSNNVAIAGSGMNQTFLWTSIGASAGGLQVPLSLYDNTEVSDLTMSNTDTNDTAFCIGRQYATLGDPTSTNVTVRNCRFKADTDAVWISNAGSFKGVGEGDMEFNFYDCIFDTRFDTFFLESSSNDPAPGSDSPCVARSFGCTHFARGPSRNPTAIARGDVTNIRMLGYTARFEAYSSLLHSSGGTNITSLFFVQGPAEASGGGYFLNSCFGEVIGTNMSAGGVGACFGQNTNGFIAINSALVNSNNIIGTGTNVWRVSRYRENSASPAAGQPMAFHDANTITNLPFLAGTKVQTNSSSSPGVVLAGVADKVWKTDGSGNPAWRDDATGAGGGDAILVNSTAVSDSGSLTNTAATASIASTTWSVSSGADPDPDKISVAIGPASATDAGIITAGTQTIGGNKTWSGAATYGGNLVVEGILGVANNIFAETITASNDLHVIENAYMFSLTVSNAITNNLYIGKGTNNSFVFLNGTNNGGFGFEARTSGQTNVFKFDVVNPAADQIFRIANIVTAGGTNLITLTNVASSGGTIDDTAFASSWNGVTTIGPSKNVVYDWGHIFDTDDDGKVNVLDTVAGIANTDSSGVLQTPITTSAGLSGALSDETGSGPDVFANGPALGTFGSSTNANLNFVYVTNNNAFLLTTQLVATNSTVNSNLTMNVNIGALDLVITNNISVTNFSNLESGTSKTLTWHIYPTLVNRTVVWPTPGVPGNGVYWRTNANAPMWTTLTQGVMYVLSAEWRNTNCWASISEWK